MRTSGRRVGAAAAALAAVLTLGACTGGAEGPSPDSSGDPSASAEPDDGLTRAELAASVFDGDIGTSEVLGTATGAVPDPQEPHPATIEVTEVTAGAASTLVRFTLRNVDESDPLLSLDAFNSRSPLTRDIRDVALVDGANNQRLQPFLGVPTDPEEDGSFCTCSTAPVQMSQVGQLLSATFPPLDPGATTVALEVPGFPLIEDLPVSRD